MTLAELRAEIKGHERDLAPGSETNMLGHFNEDCRKVYGVLPYDDRAYDIEVEEEFVDYWRHVYCKMRPVAS
jgi:hypothetical protein